MLKNSSILITGGAASFGHTFIPMILEKYNPKKIVILSRDEMKQWEVAKLFKDDSRVRFMIGDVHDKDRLYRALDGIDYLAIKDLDSKITVLIIAHRLTTLRDCDKIVKLGSNHVLSTGSYQEIVNK
jgi:short-subunit dehydrogenase involved in D-alanine esterification of teichoic acids